MDVMIKQLFEKGRQMGFEAQEVYIQDSKKLSMSVYKQELDKYSLSENGGISYRGIVDGKMGYSYTEKMDDQAVEMLVNEAFQNAKIIENEDVVRIYKGDEDYKKINLYNPELEQVPISQKIDFLMALEKSIEAKDPRIYQVTASAYEESDVFVRIINTEGLDLSDHANYCIVYTMISAKEDGDTRTGFSYQVGNDFDKFSIDYLTDEATREALNLLGAKSTKSKACEVVFKNDAFAQLQSAFNGVLSAENVQKNLSKFKDKLNEQVASEKFTLIDNPHLEDGIASGSFDAEGVATRINHVIENGVLKTYFHNLKTAQKSGVHSTGNASKGSYKGTIGISATNIYVQPDRHSFEEIIGSVKDGIYIIDLQGLHAGLSQVSGDFSLQCYGYHIQNGKLDKPVSQITVAGNYFEMLKEIDMIGNDLKFTIMGAAYTGSPTIKIKKLSISGE
ncbi:TldD/PmbA family protein [Fusibacter ferrireducens]|uniref:TldD/PmbA family protein n=1 Tax=Fusibacter ferrireducens TaxID=2785058 RepID=A0ABR9ZYS7_9FIRM|nr:TldD/PmbA family protein [Fusibacter ferrireducens]MBF4695615.1 TldD/PmbA family protein [Fusibacter ferrireducens]